MPSYASRVKRDIDRWAEIGLVDASTAASLAHDVDARAGRGISFGSILAMLAALLFAAAILMFVAADWAAIPRALRAVGLVALIVALFIAAAALKGRGQPALCEAVRVAGAAAIGATLILVRQMYALPGDEGMLLLLWCVGTAAATALCRSAALTVGAAGLAVAWLFVEGSSSLQEWYFAFLYPPIVAGVWLLSLFTRSAATRNLLALSASIYAVLLSFQFHASAVGIAFALLSGASFVAAAALPQRIEAVLLIGGHAPAQFLLAMLTGLAIVQFDLADSSGFAVSAAAVLAATAAALLLGGRGSRGVRRLAYLGFALEIGVIYAITVGSLLGTAGFFFAAALLFGALALLIIRLERRWTAGEAPA